MARQKMAMQSSMREISPVKTYSSALSTFRVNEESKPV